MKKKNKKKNKSTKILMNKSVYLGLSSAKQQFMSFGMIT